MELEDKEIKEETREKFKDLCNRYYDIISKGGGDIGKTLLVEMDIDTGDSPPITSRPYTLPLKHDDSVRKEIDTLDRAGIIRQMYIPLDITSCYSSEEIQPQESHRREECA